jgi:hypothetical protein
MRKIMVSKVHTYFLSFMELHVLSYMQTYLWCPGYNVRQIKYFGVITNITIILLIFSHIFGFHYDIFEKK